MGRCLEHVSKLNRLKKKTKTSDGKESIMDTPQFSQKVQVHYQFYKNFLAQCHNTATVDL